MLVKQNIKF